MYKYSIVLPTGYDIVYNDSTSQVNGKILGEGVVIKFLSGFFSPNVLDFEYDDSKIKFDTIRNYIKEIIVQKRSGKSSVSLILLDTVPKADPSELQNKSGINMAALDLDSTQLSKVLRIFQTVNPKFH
jgi:hypothetical protein